MLRQIAIWLVLGAAGAAASGGETAPDGADLSAPALFERLAELDGQAADSSAADPRQVHALLVEEMERAGLEEISGFGASTRALNLSGVLQGESGKEIVLSAAGGTGVASGSSIVDVAGCAIVLTAAADLARTPRRHSVRILLYGLEQEGQSGPEAWLDGLSTAARNRLLAHLQVDLAAGGNRQVVHLAPASRGGQGLVAPGWLVRAVLEGMDAVGERPVVSTPVLSLMGQLVARLTGWDRGSTAATFQRRGVPSILLSDSGLMGWSADPDRLDRPLDPAWLGKWSSGLAATVRRLDGLVGRPPVEIEYLVVWGRVWLRRGLYWIGFLVWTLLVWRGLPRRWRPVRRAERTGRGSAYLAGFFFRMLFLIAVFATPAFAVSLLLPAAAIVLLQPRHPRSRAAGLVIGLLPVSILSVLSALLVHEGYSGPEIAWTPALLIAACLLSFISWIRPVFRDTVGE